MSNREFNTSNQGIFTPDEEPIEVVPVTFNKIVKALHRIDPTNRALSAAAIKNVRNVNTSEQLKDCAEAYANNGMVRTIIDKNIWFIQGSNAGFIVEPNNELLEGLTDEEITDLEKELQDKYKELRTDTIRINKRVQLHDRTTKFLTHRYVFGQSYLGISRNKPGLGTGTNKFPRYGEPMALKVLNPLRIEDKIVNTEDFEFEAIIYNYGTNIKGQKNKKVRIPVTDLICGWYDDANVFDNTYYSGMSPVWTILSASQIIETILDENIPEFVKAIAEGIGAIYTGTNKESVTKQIKEALKHSTFFLHNQKDLDIKEINIARDPQEIVGLLKMLGQYMCQSLGLPLFLMYEDTANFATANQVMQAYKVTTILRERQWLSNLLEKYWYDPILADWFDCDVSEVIEQEIRLKPVFEDVNFETNLDIITGAEKLLNMDVYNRVDCAKAIHNREVANRLIMEGAIAADEEVADIKLEQQRLAIEGQEKQNQQIGKVQPGGGKPSANNPANKQQNK